MKFFCHSCNTKYGIADEKVRGKVLKVRCKNCGEVITVREHAVPEAAGAGQRAASPPASSGPDPARVDWHYSVNGETFGPYDYDALCELFAAGTVGTESYVWTESFSSWKPVSDVSAFAAALQQGQAVKPRNNTIGVSQALQAVNPDDFDSQQPQQDNDHGRPTGPRQGQQDQPHQGYRTPQRPRKPQRNASSGASRPAQNPTQADEPDIGAGPDTTEPDATEPDATEPDKLDSALRGLGDIDDADPTEVIPAPTARELEDLAGRDPADTPESATSSDSSAPGESSGRKDRLAKLRQRLNASKSDQDGSPTPEASALDADFDDVVADGGAESTPDDADTPDDDKAAAGKHDADNDPVADDGALGPTLPMDGPDEASAEAPDSLDAQRGANSGLFDDIDADTGPDQAFPDDAAGAAMSAPAAGEMADESDKIPFLAGSPELDGGQEVVDDGPDRGDGITGSLLIQLDEIQKEGRAKSYLMVAAGLVVVVGLVGAAVYLSWGSETDQTVADTTKSSASDTHNAVIHTYSDEEQNKIAALGDDRTQTDNAESDEAGAGDKGPPAEAGGQRRATRSPKSAPAKSESDDSDDGASLEQALNSANKRKRGDTKFGGGIDDGAIVKTKMDSPLVDGKGSFDSVAALQSDERADSIYKPNQALNDKKKADNSGGSKLSRDQISQGVRTVRHSVGVCRQRHSRRGQPLEARKIFMTLTVESDGDIREFELAPERLNNTVFERCLQSHRGRWHFPAFSGDAERFRAPFVLQ